MPEDQPDHQPIRLLLADDQALVREALAALLNLENDIEVVAQTERGDQVVAECRRYEVDVALVDIEMPGLDGIATVEQLTQHCPKTRSLIVTTFGRPGYLRRALDAGASGFVVKDINADELASAVRKVHAGQRVLNSELAEQSLFDGASPLTAREREVLVLALDALPASEIADLLSLSEGTVRNYLSSAVAKTGAGSTMQAAVWARDRGWL